MVLAKGQITITSVEPISSPTQPANRFVGMVWIDTSVSPSLLKRWTGTVWEIVNEVRVGGRNLLLDSGVEVTNADYLIKYYWASSLTPNTKYTIVIKANMPVGQEIAVYFNMGYYEAKRFARIAGTHVYFAHILSPSTIDFNGIHLFNIPQSKKSATIYYSCMYEGHINPPLDWIPAPEDIQSKFNALNYLKTALAGSTDIDGGLLVTNLILMKNQQGNVVSGLSGLTGDNVSGWFGGTYANALADAQKDYRSAKETGGLDKKDGSGHKAFGNFSWNTSGDIFIKGTIEAFAGRIGFFDIYEDSLFSGNVKLSNEPLEPLNNFHQPLTVIIPRNSSTWQVTGTTEAHAYTENFYVPFDFNIDFGVSTFYGNTSRPSWEVRIVDNNNQTIFVDGANGSISSKRFSLYFKAGTYSIHAYSRSSVTSTTTPSAIVSLFTFASGTTSIIAVGNINLTKIGSDGLMSYSDSSNYMYYTPSHGYEYKGKLNFPGVLASGSVSNSGAQTNLWGAKKIGSNANYTATGIYDVPHQAGSVYQVMIQPTTDNVRATVISKGYNVFRVQLRTNSGSTTIGSFDYVIFGSN